MTQTTVLLHGFTGSPASFDQIAEGLEGRVLRPLLPGHGPDPRPVRSWGEEVSALTQWLEREGVTGAHLVGYSFGGRLGWHLLERDDLFCRATLIGAHPGLPDEVSRATRRDADARWIELLEGEGLGAFVDAWEALPLFESQRALPTSIRSRQRAVRSSHTARGLAAALRELGLAEMPARPTPRLPTALVVGALDARHRGIAEALELPLAIVPGAGHNVALEAPSRLLELLR